MGSGRATRFPFQGGLAAQPGVQLQPAPSELLPVQEDLCLQAALFWVAHIQGPRETGREGPACAPPHGTPPRGCCSFIGAAGAQPFLPPDPVSSSSPRVDHRKCHPGSMSRSVYFQRTQSLVRTFSKNNVYEETFRVIISFLKFVSNPTPVLTFTILIKNRLDL